MNVFRRLLCRASESEKLLEILGKLGLIVGMQPKYPVFIIGTGRCGTSLLTRILESHHEISVFTDEANHLWHPQLYPLEKFENNQIVPFPFEVDPVSFTQTSVKNWPAKHAERIRHIFNGYYVANGTQKTLVVKSAMISFMILNILDLYPNARFIHLYRYGPAVVESLVKKNYGKYIRFTCSEGEYRLACAKYWNSCVLEIDKVRNTLFSHDASRFFELSYEDLCANPEEIIHKIASFIGVHTDAFGFDFSSIRSMNWRVEASNENYKWQQSLLVMKPAMELKGYLKS